MTPERWRLAAARHSLESEVLRRLRKMRSDRALEADARARARQAWDKLERCGICDRKMGEDEDYGGDCVFCMADAGDDVAIEHVERRVEKWKAASIRGPSG